jgi:hypothetical protein
MDKIAIWLTYDLGVGGDFQGMYSWLDDNEAVECGNNVSFLKYKLTKQIKADKELVELIKSDLLEKVKFIPSNRIYIIWRSLEKGNIIGNFIIGKRKSSPWEGYGTKVDNTIDG